MADEKRTTPPNLRPQRKFPPLSTFHDRPFRWLLRFWFCTRFRRGKMACPACGAGGTFKPFGGHWIDRPVRRWLCKWCGFYDGVDGRFWAVVDRKRGCWVLPVDEERESAEEYFQRVESGELTTPQKIMAKESINPWAG